MLATKIYPIKVERSWDHYYKLVEWKLGNTCNYDCSFCGSNNKNGSERWLDISVYKNVCLQLIEQASKENKKVIFQFTGGEPTLFPDLLELLEFVKDNGAYSNLISNGSRTLRWWSELAEADAVTSLFLSAHPEQNADIDHIIKITELFKNNSTDVLVLCTALPKFFEQAVSFYNRLYETACCKITLKLINSEPNYNSEQLGQITKNTVVPSKRYKEKTLPNKFYAGKMKLTFNDKTEIKYFAHQLIALGINKFFGYKCSIGIDYLNIRYDKIYRGICGEGGVTGSIYEPVTFRSDPVTCLKQSCDCGTDYNEPKYKVDVVNVIT